MKPLETRLIGRSGFWNRAPNPLVLLVPVPVLLIVVLLGPNLMLGLSMIICAVILTLMAFLGFVLRQQVRARERMLRDAVPILISNDANPAFLADEDGQISYANQAADARFNKGNDNTIAGRLATVIANPDAVLYRLQSRAQTLASAQEDVLTRTGQYRLSVAQVGGTAYLWRFDDLGARPDKSTSRGTDTMSLPMLTVGQSGAILYLNEAFRKLLGRRPLALADIFGTDPLRSGQVHRIKTDRSTVDCIVAEVKGTAGRREIYALPANSGGQGPRPLGAGWDAIEDLPVPLLKIARNGALIASNREARALLGITEPEGKRVADILDGLGRPMNDWISEAVDGRGGQVSQFLRGRGSYQDTFVQVTLNISGEDDDAHLIAVLNDVTELKTLEGQFVQSQKMHAIGQLAGGVAHDFNNLLTAISGHCDLLLLRHDQGDQDYSDLIQIHQNANRAAGLVGQLLAFSRKQNLQPEVIDMREALSDLTHLLNRLIGEKVVLSLRHDPDLLPIKADKRQLEQVLMNLVVNARDAMPGGGTIQIETENRTLTSPMEQDRAFVPPGEYVFVRVTDEGHGISPEKLPKIFEPFYSTKRTGEGTGLGLSTAYGIMKQTGGFIFAESEVNQGTQFTLIFPAHDIPIAAPEAVAKPQPALSAGAVDGVVLLVEDEAPVRAFASRALRLRGYTVLEADCAEAALALLADPELTVDVFVTDVIMPGMDGPTWVREALQQRPETRVVFVSGYAEDAFGDEGSRIPNSVFLPKPFSLNDLTMTVQQQLH